MNIDPQTIEAVAEYLRTHRFQRDRSVRQMAREALTLAEQVRTGNLPKPQTPAQIADTKRQRERARIAAYQRKHPENGNREVTR